MKILETKNLILRPFNVNDTNDFYELLKDIEIKDLFEKLRFKQDITLTDAEWMLSHFGLSHSKGDFRYAIVEKECGKLIGGLLSDLNAEKTTPGITIFIKSNMRGKGFAKEAILEFIRYAAMLGYKKIQFEALKRNINSINLISSIENMGDLGVTLETKLLDDYGYRGNIVEEKEAELGIINEAEVIIVWEGLYAQIFSTNGQVIGYIKIEVDENARKIIVISSINNNTSQFEMDREQVKKLFEEKVDVLNHIKSRIYTTIKKGHFQKYQNGECVFYPYTEMSDKLLEPICEGKSRENG